MSSGFAFYSLLGECDINTVSTTERGAKVNAIVRLSQGLVWITNTATEEEINDCFDKIKVGQGEVYPVTITRKPGN